MAGWSLTLVGGGTWQVSLKNKWEVGSEIGVLSRLVGVWAP